MGARVNYSGLVVAVVGFVLTRFTVTLALYEDPVRFYLAGVVPLTLGLGLSAFGVALVVADVEAALVRTTARWCVAGTGAMLVLVLLTLLGSTSGGMPALTTIRSRAYLSNFLIGGSVGGTLTGLYASCNRRQRDELERQANRLAILNRLLRHEILNGVAVIRGYAALDGEGAADSRAVIEERSDDIERTIEEVKHLTGRVGGGRTSPVSVDLGECLAAGVETVADRHPDARVALGPVPEGLSVRANEQLSHVFAHLFENAVVHGGDDAPVVEVTTTGRSVRVSVTDEGSGLPDSQRSLLESGDIEEFDDPGTGFGLNVVRLLVESYGGTMESTVTEAGTTIEVVLARVETGGAGPQPRRAELTGVRPAAPHLAVTFVAAILAGVLYGVASELLGGSVAGIGVFYGATNTVVGWLTHEFHSLVFGFVFVSLVSLVPERYRSALTTYVAVGVGWAVVLWVVAAGLVAPVWLRLLGIPASVPNFSFPLLVSHLVWGGSLGVFTAWGYSYLAPVLTRLGDRTGRRSESVRPSARDRSPRSE